ncbi:hypothetical protein BGX20_003641, partial [Mortierella sp. AD010]
MAAFGGPKTMELHDQDQRPPDSQHLEKSTEIQEALCSRKWGWTSFNIRIALIGANGKSY